MYPRSMPLSALSTGRVLVEVELDGEGQATAGVAVARIDAPPARVFSAFREVERYAGRVPMIQRVRRGGDHVNVELRFRMPLFSVRFAFRAAFSERPPEWIDLRWVSGEPRGLHIRHDLEPLDGGSATRVRTRVGFDILSLGWLVKYFLHHHPEIRFGVFSGSALVLQDGLRREVR
jgi:carbon monoxide dehydrogenase subunit G